MQLFYNQHISEDTKQFTFDKDESRHIVRVLRKKEGDILYITNGNHYLFTVKIVIASDKKCIVTIIKKEEKKSSRNYYLHVAIAPTKNNDRLEWFLEKATEIGIDEITPIICKNSERKVVKTERLAKIIQAAMKQSLQYKLPKLNEPVKFSEFIQQKLSSQLFIAHCEDDAKKNTLKDGIDLASSYTILIGPEGDFSTDEIKKSLSQKFTPITLGNTRLRTETAGLTAVQQISFLHQ
ncbi:16S rRNA (uracil1498-N3)-methyltransferase [Tenacibaculum sp. MAR_2010_89]|uniref:16S rRNA (uracil(1498)-N(3))-methyltransferase n=1 Tax=Tenacibaculum sp. MAR_2010_89 TaxID=1250198 RepID=UPI00089ACFC0|nr:16S rRNA (uracil(1498)-N(3))-methyltransferase [Tenacibaculum sp. MAR_2010_89]SEE38224.1 16S rRNA (uracil1498-N3)-methyltransferase [Tenacibaculum sp. MAR_2010_89]